MVNQFACFLASLSVHLGSVLISSIAIAAVIARAAAIGHRLPFQDYLAVSHLVYSVVRSNITKMRMMVDDCRCFENHHSKSLGENS